MHNLFCVTGVYLREITCFFLVFALECELSEHNSFIAYLVVCKKRVFQDCLKFSRACTGIICYLLITLYSFRNSVLCKLITVYSFRNSVLCKLHLANFSWLLAFHCFTLLQWWSVQRISFACSQVVRNQPSNRYGHSFDAFCGITLLFEIQNQKMQASMKAVLVFWRECGFVFLFLLTVLWLFSLTCFRLQICRQCIWNTALFLVF